MRLEVRRWSENIKQNVLNGAEDNIRSNTDQNLFTEAERAVESEKITESAVETAKEEKKAEKGTYRGRKTGRMKGHIFAGVWLVEESFSEMIVDDPSQLEKRMSRGIHEMDVVD